ncbi:hypothetical protein UT300018_22250 [Clostridium faecium]
MRKIKKYLVIINIILLILLRVLNLDLFEIKYKNSSSNIRNLVNLYRENYREISYLMSTSKNNSHRHNHLKAGLSDIKRKIISYGYKNIGIIFLEENHSRENSELLYRGFVFFGNSLNKYNISKLFTPFILFLDYRTKIRKLLKSKFNGSSYKESYLIKL